MTLRILITLDAVGGVWRYAVDLGAVLVRAGHQIVFAGLGPEPDPVQRDEAQAIGPLEWGRAPLDWLASGPEDLAGVPGWLEEIAARHEVDLLHLNQPALAAGLRDGRPRVVMTHSCLATWFRAMDGAAVPGHLAWQVDLTRAGLLAADRVVAPSAAHAALTEKVYGIRGILAVPNASRSLLAAPSTGNGRVVAAARWWDKAKNGGVLDQAARLTKAPVTMIGSCDGPDGQSFAPGHLPAPSALSHPETLDRIAAASLFVSPSLYEPFGLAALEAARAGRPLLLSDIGVYRELWDGAARFFRPRDPADLARAIDALLQDPDERLSLGAAARARALRYNLDHQAAAMTEIYREITAPAQVSVTA